MKETARSKFELNLLCARSADTEEFTAVWPSKVVDVTLLQKLEEQVEGGMSAHELAYITGIPYNSVRSRIRRLVEKNVVLKEKRKTGHSGPPAWYYTLNMNVGEDWTVEVRVCTVCEGAGCVECRYSGRRRWLVENAKGGNENGRIR